MTKNEKSAVLFVYFPFFGQSDQKVKNEKWNEPNISQKGHSSVIQRKVFSLHRGCHTGVVVTQWLSHSDLTMDMIPHGLLNR